MNKTISKILIGVMTISTVATASPVFAKNEKNEKNENRGRGNSNSVVTFTSNSSSSNDASRTKILQNGNILKLQLVGPKKEEKKLLKDLNLKFKLHENEEEFKIRIPRGTNASSSQAFVTAVKAAHTEFINAIRLARTNFLNAIKAARLTYLTPTSTPPTSPTNTAPFITISANANPTTITGNSTNLSVLGDDATGGESNLIYSWTVISKPTSSIVTFSANGTNASKNTTMTVNSAGTYQIQVTATDAGSLSATSMATVNATQTLSSVTVSPASTTVAMGSSTQFNASAFDQFTAPQSSGFTWSIFEGILGGTISSSGLYTATSTTGTFHIIGASTIDSNKRATSTVIVN
jgi:hypothetical protein